MEGKNIQITIFITCVIPLFCLTGGVSYVLFAKHTPNCLNITNNVDRNAWRPEIRISDRYSLELEVSFPISHLFVTNLFVKDGNNTVSHVSGAVNICRLQTTILRCLVRKDCHEGSMERNETIVMANVLKRTIVC